MPELVLRLALALLLELPVMPLRMGLRLELALVVNRALSDAE